jgi:hypothetical protein
MQATVPPSLIKVNVKGHGGLVYSAVKMTEGYWIKELSSVFPQSQIIELGFREYAKISFEKKNI